MSARDRLFAKLQSVSAVLEHTRTAASTERRCTPAEDLGMVPRELFALESDLGDIATRLLQAMQRLHADGADPVVAQKEAAGG